MASIWDERFEGTGYEETWSQGETIGSGSTVDEDADPADVSSPSGWGAQCLKCHSAATDAFVRHNFGGSYPVFHGYFEFVYSESRTIGAVDNICQVENNVPNNLFVFDLWKVNASVTRFQTRVNEAGAGVVLKNSTNITAGTRYRVAYVWNNTANTYEVSLNDVTTASGSLTGDAATWDADRLRVGCSGVSGTDTLTVYYDMVLANDSGPPVQTVTPAALGTTWATITPTVTNTRVWDERLEGTGYEETWSAGETVAAGSTVDEDANSADVGSPSGWGAQCLKTVTIGGDAYVRHVRASGTGLPISYTRVEFVVPSEGIPDTDTVTVLTMRDEGGTLFGRMQIRRSDGLRVRFQSYHTGFNNIYDALSTFEFAARQRIEVRWDATANEWAWRQNGIDQPNNIDSTHPVTSAGTLTLAHATEFREWLWGPVSASGSGTVYHDLLTIQTNDWVGPEAADATVTPAARPASWATLPPVATNLLTVTPAARTAAWATVAPSVTLGVLSVTPAPATAIWATGTATATQVLTVTPSALGSEEFTTPSAPRFDIVDQYGHATPQFNTNGEFETDLTGWTEVGDVSIVGGKLQAVLTAATSSYVHRTYGSNGTLPEAWLSGEVTVTALPFATVSVLGMTDGGADAMRFALAVNGQTAVWTMHSPNSTLTLTGFTVTAGQSYWVNLYWRQATAANNDGVGIIWIDGVEAFTSRTFSNTNTIFIDGTVAGLRGLPIPTSATGTVLVDHIEYGSTGHVGGLITTVGAVTVSPPALSAVWALQDANLLSTYSLTDAVSARHAVVGAWMRATTETLDEQFDTDLSAWDETGTPAIVNGRLRVTSGATGSYGIDTKPGEDYNLTEGWLTATVNVVSENTATDNTDFVEALIGLTRDTSGNPLLALGFGQFAGVTKWRIHAHDDVVGSVTTPATMSAATVYHIALYWRSATAAGANDGIARVWVDGTQILNSTTIDSDTLEIDGIAAGAFGTNNAVVVTVDIDHIALGTDLDYTGGLTVTVGAVTLTPPALPAVWAVVNANLLETVSPATLSSTWAVQTPVVTFGTITASPAAQTAVWATRPAIAAASGFVTPSVLVSALNIVDRHGHADDDGLSETFSGTLASWAETGTVSIEAGHLKAVSTAAALEPHTIRRSSVNSVTEAWLAGQVTVEADASANTDYNEAMFGIVKDAAGNELAALGYTNDAGTLKWQVLRRVDAGQQLVATTTTLSVGTTYWMVLHWKASTAAGRNNGILRVWIDGVLIHDVSTLDTDTLVSTGVIAGIGLNAGQFASTVNVDTISYGTSGWPPADPAAGLSVIFGAITVSPTVAQGSLWGEPVPTTIYGGRTYQPPLPFNTGREMRWALVGPRLFQTSGPALQHRGGTITLLSNGSRALVPGAPKA